MGPNPHPGSRYGHVTQGGLVKCLICLATGTGAWIRLPGKIQDAYLIAFQFKFGILGK